MKELFELLHALLKIDSVTGNECSCAEFLRRHLGTHGFRVEMQPVSAGRTNIFGTVGKPEVVLSTHMDTVPGILPVREDSEALYGRGACDAKGSLACQLVAAEHLAKEGVAGFGVLFLVGEETVSDGARAANQAARGAKFLIMGEPTENKLIVATKGILHLGIRVEGESAHSAYPNLGRSAIHSLLDILGELRAMPLPADPKLGPATMNIGLIAGGRAANVLADRAEADILYRTVDDAGELRKTLERILAGRCRYEILRRVPPQRMDALEGFETSIASYTTDVSNLDQWGTPFLLGPGSFTVAHTDREHVRKADLVRAVDLYCRLVRELKARSGQTRKGGAS